MTKPKFSRTIFPPKRTLLVDDVKPIRQMLREFLESLDMEVLEASSGAEAIHLAKTSTGNIDLLLTDVEMPGMSGLAAAREIAQFYPHIAIIFMSAGNTPEEWTQFMEKLNRVHFLHKPFHLRDLKALLMDIHQK